MISALIGFWGLLKNEVVAWDCIRDAISLFSPIVYIIFAKNLFRIYSLIDLERAIIFSSVVIEVRHLLLILTSGVGLYESREIIGFSSAISCIAFVLITQKKSEEKLIKSKNVYYLVTAFITIMLICYLSRTVMMLLLCMFIGIVIGEKHILKKILKIGMKLILILGFIISILIAFRNTKIIGDMSAQIEPFIRKLYNSINEVGIRNDWSDFSLINTNWRGYENLRVVESIKNAALGNILFGFGFGSRLKLGITMNLAGTKYSDIPIMHSGYYYLLFKCGLVSILTVLIICNGFIIKTIRILHIKSNSQLKITVGIIAFILIGSVFSGTIFESGGYAILLFYSTFSFANFNKNSTRCVKQGSERR